MTQATANKAYFKLLSDLLKIKTEIQNRISKDASIVLAQGYWQMGKRLCVEDMFNGEATSQSRPLLSQLASGLRMEYSLLTRIIKFYKTWPKECPVKKNENVTWSHFKQLMALPDDKQRAFYLKGVQDNGWKKTDLSTKIKRKYYEFVINAKTTKQGVLKRSKDRMYCYSGTVVKVVDGDTLRIEVDLGFYVKLDVRLRLKGINTAELGKGSDENKAIALKAREYVCEKLKNCSLIVFQTFTVDSYGRYVADVFYLPGESKKEKIFEKGVFLNQELLDQGLAVLF